MVAVSESTRPTRCRAYLDASSVTLVAGHATACLGLAAPFCSYLLVSADNDGSRCAHDGLQGSASSWAAVSLSSTSSLASCIPRSWTSRRGKPMNVCISS